MYGIINNNILQYNRLLLDNTRLVARKTARRHFLLAGHVCFKLKYSNRMLILILIIDISA